MSKSSVITPQTFKFNELNLTVPKKNTKTKKLNAYLNGKTGSKQVKFETYELLTPFGVSGFETSPGSGKFTYSLSLSAKSLDPENDEAVEKWFDEWDAGDEFMLKYGVEHSEIICGKKTGSTEVMEQCYNTFVKGEKGGDYPRRLSPKIKGVRDNLEKPDVKVYVKTKSGKFSQLKVDTFEDLTSLIQGNTYVKAVLSPYCYFFNKKYGISLSVTQILIDENSKDQEPECAFGEIETDEPVVPESKVEDRKSVV